jgi:hypothetical protein
MVSRGQIRLAKSRKIGRHEVKLVRKEGNQVSKHVAGAGKTVEQQEGRSVGSSRLAVEHLYAVNFDDVVSDFHSKMIDFRDVAAGLVSPADLEIIAQHMSPGEVDGASAQAKASREWFRGFVPAHKGHKLSSSAFAELERLNEILELDELFWKIAPVEPGQSVDQWMTHGLTLERRWILAEVVA